MSYFAVIREAGPGWTDGHGTMGQPGVGDHAAFMNALADDGVVLLAGPLAGTKQGTPSRTARDRRGIRGRDQPPSGR
jgi:hypothetical protein